MKPHQLKAPKLTQHISEINRVMNQGLILVKDFDNSAKDGVDLMESIEALIRDIIEEDGFYVTETGKVLYSI